MKRLLYETESCGRCGGSGWNSYCEMWGRTCFECGVKPHEQGTGRRFTKAAKVAQAAVAGFIKERFSRRADAVEPGMLILAHGRTPARVLSVADPGCSGVQRPDGSVKWGVTLQTKHCGYGYQHEHLVQVVPSDADWDAVVVPFARTLQAVSVEGDTPVGVYRLVTGKNRRVEYVTRSGSVDAALDFISARGPKVRRRMFIAPVEHDAGRSKSWAA